MVTKAERCNHGFLRGQCTSCKEKEDRVHRVVIYPQYDRRTTVPTGTKPLENGSAPAETPGVTTPPIEVAAVNAVTHPILGTPLSTLSAEQIKLKQAFERVPLGVMLQIPADRVKPLKDQPRMFFNRHRISRLKESIAQRQQRDSSQARWLPGDPHWFCELIDGERRLRAILTTMQPGKPVPLIKVVVRVVSDEEEQFEESAIANAGREGYAPLELAHIVHRLGTKRGRTLEEIAVDLNITSNYATMLKTLIRLHPDLQVMMDPGLPRKKRLGLGLALQLARTHDQTVQLMLFREVREQGMSVARAVLYIRRRMAELGLVDTDTQEKRTPSRDRYVLKASLGIVATRLQIIKDMQHQLGTLYRDRTQEEVAGLIRSAEGVAELAIEVHDMLQNCREPMPAEPVRETEEALAV